MAKDETFDAGAYLSATVDQPFETEFQVVAEGTFQAMVDDFDEKAIEKFDFEYKQGDRQGQPGSMIKFTCPFSIQDPAVLAKMARDKVVVPAEFILDRDALGQLDFGKDKNVRLGQLRKAVNQNQPGPWSAGNLRGAGPLMVKVVHEHFKRADGSPGKKAKVIAFAPLKV